MSSRIWNARPTSVAKRSRRSRAARGDAGGQHRSADQCAGLQPVHALELLGAQPAALGIEIDGLPAGHAERSRGVGEQAHEVDHLPGIEPGRVRQHLERERLQCVRGEDRRGLVELAVHRGLAAPQVVVVHRRQVVVHQRERVQQLDRSGRGIEQRRVERQAFPGRVHQERPHPLAAVHRVTHGLVEAFRRRVRARQHPIEAVGDATRVLRAPLGE
jgi:hypothetical protein